MLYLSPSWNIWPTSIPFLIEYVFPSFLWSWSIISWSDFSSNNSRLLANNSSSLKIILSSPESANTWNSSDADPPIAPESAETIL